MNTLKKLTNISTNELITVLTLLWPFVFIHQDIGQDPTILLTQLICLAAILFPKLREGKHFFLVVLLSYLIHAFLNIDFNDNHRWLYAIWLLALTLSQYYPDKEIIKKNSRWLLIIVFFFATFWKIWFGEYADGSFIRTIIFDDTRFQAFAHYFLNFSFDEVKINSYVLNNSYLLDNVPQAFQNTIEYTPKQMFLSKLISWLTVLIEGLIFFFYLAAEIKKNEKIQHIADILLVAFCSTLYLIIPVHGFAFMLIILGIAQSQSERSFNLFKIAIGIQLIGFLQTSQLF